jgi:hypothetical protein
MDADVNTNEFGTVLDLFHKYLDTSVLLVSRFLTMVS